MKKFLILLLLMFVFVFTAVCDGAMHTYDGRRKDGGTSPIAVVQVEAEIDVSADDDEVVEYIETNGEVVQIVLDIPALTGAVTTARITLQNDDCATVLDLSGFNEDQIVATWPPCNEVYLAGRTRVLIRVSNAQAADVTIGVTLYIK